MDVEKAIKTYFDDIQNQLSRNTVISYRHGMAHFVTFIQSESVDVKQPVTELGMDHFIAFPAWLLREGFAKQSISIYMRASRSFLEWMIVAGFIAPTYQETLRLKSATLLSRRNRHDRLPRWPQKDDVSKILEAAHTYTEKSPQKERNIALLEFLASSGCRISEVMALNVQDIDVANKTTVVTGKGNKERRVFFSSSAAAALIEYWKMRLSMGANDPAFARHDKGAGKRKLKRITATTARNIVKEIAIVAGVDPTKFSPHYFRHAFAIRMLSETGNIALVQDLLGHSDPKSTRIYAKIYPEKLQDAHRLVFK